MKEAIIKDEFGKSKYVDEVTINHSPIEFVLDFKKMTPRFTRNNDNTTNTNLVVEHTPLVMTPYFAKILLITLKTQVNKYEEKVGKIEINEYKKDEKVSSYIGWKNGEYKELEHNNLVVYWLHIIVLYFGINKKVFFFT